MGISRILFHPVTLAIASIITVIFAIRYDATTALIVIAKIIIALYVFVSATIWVFDYRYELHQALFVFSIICIVLTLAAAIFEHDGKVAAGLWISFGLIIINAFVLVDLDIKIRQTGPATGDEARGGTSEEKMLRRLYGMAKSQIPVALLALLHVILFFTSFLALFNQLLEAKLNI